MTRFIHRSTAIVLGSLLALASFTMRIQAAPLRSYLRQRPAMGGGFGPAAAQGFQQLSFFNTGFQPSFFNPGFVGNSPFLANVAPFNPGFSGQAFTFVPPEVL